jgi:hypothetical protein
MAGNYSTVCKRWNQLCRDNELWRRYCLEKWDNNPKESDCAKNWFIPGREGGKKLELYFLVGISVSHLISRVQREQN